MHKTNKSLVILTFVVIAASAIILVSSGGNIAQESADELESRFIDATTQEK